MKKKLLTTVLFMLLLLGISTISYGAISATSKTVNSGETVTISVSSSDTLGAYEIQVTNNGGLTFVSANPPSVAAASGTKITGSATSGVTSLGSFTFRAPTVSKDTNYYVKISSTLAEGIAPSFTEYPLSTATATITVKAPQVSNPSPTPSSKPSPTPVTLTFSNASGTMYTTSAVNFRSSYGTSASRIGTIPAGEEVTITAKSNEKLNNEYWSKVTYKGTTGYVASSYLTATKPEVKPSAEPSTPPSTAPEEQKSNDSSLKSLSITGVEITPAFDSRIFNYDANILDTTITEVEVLAEVNDEKAKYEIIGNTDLKNGENIISVAVTAEDGTVSRYDIKLIIGVIETPSPEPTPVVAQTTNESPLSKKQIAIIAGIVVGAVLVIILLVRHHRKQDDLDYGETDYSFLKNDEEIQNKEKDRRQEFLDGFDNNDDDDKRKGGKHF